MSEARDKYYELKKEVDKYHDGFSGGIHEYVSELEAENGELQSDLKESRTHHARLAVEILNMGNKITELEQQNKELVKFVELMNLYGGLSPEFLPTKSDIIFYESDRLLKKHGVEI